MKQLIAAFLLATFFVGCGGQKANDISKSSSAVEVQVCDPLTGGELVWGGQRPVAVVVDNSAEGTDRQKGLSSASVVAEVLTTGSSTTLCLLYPSVQTLPTFGAVSEGNDVYWRLFAPLNILPIQRGADIYTDNYLDYANLMPLDALEAGRIGFAYQGGYGISDDVSWYSDSRMVGEAVQDLGLTTTTETGHNLFAFGNGMEGEEGTDVKVTFAPESTTAFSYQEGVYQMKRGDAPQLDANDGKQAGFENVLVLYASSGMKEDGVYRDYSLIKGCGVLLSGGKWKAVNWTRGSQEIALTLTDTEGNLCSVPNGRTYIAVLGGFAGQALTVSAADGTVQELGLTLPQPLPEREPVPAVVYVRPATPAPSKPQQAAEQAPASTEKLEAQYAAVYNYEYYRANHPDLVAQFGDDRGAYISHFINSGMAEGRRASENFDVKAYKNRYSDLRNSYGNNLKKYYLHYINYGRKEKRNAT